MGGDKEIDTEWCERSDEPWSVSWGQRPILLMGRKRQSHLVSPTYEKAGWRNTACLDSGDITKAVMLDYQWVYTMGGKWSRCRCDVL